MFVLRFVLSAPKRDAGAAFNNVADTLRYRAQRLDALKLVRTGAATPEMARLRACVKTGVVGFLNGLHPVFVVRAGRANVRGLMADLSMDELVQVLVLNNEYVWRLCDGKTRESGLLVKAVTVVDLQGMSIFQFDSKFPRAIGKSSTLSSVYYPQLLGQKVIVNLPAAVRWMIKVFTSLQPASAVEKQSICTGATLSGDASKCPYLAKFTNVAVTLPKFLGGTAPCPAELSVE